jgi:hypothetical protein
MHEKNGAFVVQDTSTGHLNLSCAVLSLDSSVFIFWNRYCTYAWFSRKVVCCHTCPRRKRCCLVCSSAACCLYVAQGSSCSSRDHTTLTRQTQVLPSCCPRAALVTDMTGFTRNVRTDAYPQKHAALLLRRARLLSCICTRKTVPLLFRTPQPVMCRSVSAVICVHPWNRYCTYTGSIIEVQL